MAPIASLQNPTLKCVTLSLIAFKKNQREPCHKEKSMCSNGWKREAIYILLHKSQADASPITTVSLQQSCSLD